MQRQMLAGTDEAYTCRSRLNVHFVIGNTSSYVFVQISGTLSKFIRRENILFFSTYIKHMTPWYMTGASITLCQAQARKKFK